MRNLTSKMRVGERGKRETETWREREIDSNVYVSSDGVEKGLKK